MSKDTPQVLEPVKINYRKLLDFPPVTEEERKLYERFYNGWMNPNFENGPIPLVETIPEALSTTPFGTPEYTDIISEWESGVRAELKDEMAEKWFFGNSDKGENFEPYMTYFGEIHSPVKVPSWLFAANTFYEENFHFDNIEIVAMAHVLHFTTPHCDTGYIECSGHIERWCRCTAEQVHRTLMNLCKKNLIFFKFLPDEVVFGLNRNLGWRANIDYIESVLRPYGRRVDV